MVYSSKFEKKQTWYLARPSKQKDIWVILPQNLNLNL